MAKDPSDCLSPLTSAKSYFSESRYSARYIPANIPWPMTQSCLFGVDEILEEQEVTFSFLSGTNHEFVLSRKKIVSNPTSLNLRSVKMESSLSGGIGCLMGGAMLVVGFAWPISEQQTNLCLTRLGPDFFQSASSNDKGSHVLPGTNFCGSCVKPPPCIILLQSCLYFRTDECCSDDS